MLEGLFKLKDNSELSFQRRIDKWADWKATFSRAGVSPHLFRTRVLFAKSCSPAPNSLREAFDSSTVIWWSGFMSERAIADERPAIPQPITVIFNGIPG